MMNSSKLGRDRGRVPGRKRLAAGRVRRRLGDDGLTLIELLVVLVILGLIAAFAVPRVMNLLGGSRQDAAEIQIKRLRSIVEIYALDTGRYPTDDEGLRALVEAPAGNARWSGPYLDNAEALIDPWGAPYQYRRDAGGTYAIISLGADGRAGGEGEDADIGVR